MKTGLTKKKALAALTGYKPTNKISRIYDCGDVSEALITLIPNFEYPEWSHRTLGDTMRYIREDMRIRKAKAEENDE